MTHLMGWPPQGTHVTNEEPYILNDPKFFLFSFFSGQDFFCRVRGVSPRRCSGRSVRRDRCSMRPSPPRTSPRSSASGPVRLPLSFPSPHKLQRGGGAPPTTPPPPSPSAKVVSKWTGLRTPMRRRRRGGERPCVHMGRWSLNHQPVEAQTGLQRGDLKLDCPPSCPHGERVVCPYLTNLRSQR